MHAGELCSSLLEVQIVLKILKKRGKCNACGKKVERKMREESSQRRVGKAVGDRSQ